LTAFVTAAQQNHNPLLTLAVINPETGANVNSQLEDAFANAFVVAEISRSNPSQA